MSDKLAVYLSPHHLAETDWIVSVLLREILGVDYVTMPSSHKGYSLRLGGKRLELPDKFFSDVYSLLLDAGSLPLGPFKLWDGSSSSLFTSLLAEPIPIFFGNPHVELGQDKIRCEIDIFGSAFFVMSRYEEVVFPERDIHDRFPATASLAYKQNFLYRPIIDEYIEILWACMSYLWPRLERKATQGQIRVTCDVDAPFDCSVANARRTIRSLGRDLIVERRPGRAIRRVHDYVSIERGNYEHDPFYTFDWYMNQCERFGRAVTFFFIPDHSSEGLDGCYSPFDKRIQALIQKLSDHEHEIGTHGSYNSYNNDGQVLKEKKRIKAALERARVRRDVSGNRQHYLRWDTAQTPDYLDMAGYEYDTTGSFADMPGFRYGTAHMFTMWSWKKSSPLNIKQRPLIMMECSVISARYLGLGYTEEALNLMLTLKQRALKYGGDFTFLWHNSHLMTSQDREFFEEMIK